MIVFGLRTQGLLVAVFCCSRGREADGLGHSRSVHRDVLDGCQYIRGRRHVPFPASTIPRTLGLARTVFPPEVAVRVYDSRRVLYIARIVYIHGGLATQVAAVTCGVSTRLAR